jgi:hypothetical protein
MDRWARPFVHAAQMTERAVEADPIGPGSVALQAQHWKETAGTPVRDSRPDHHDEAPPTGGPIMRTANRYDGDLQMYVEEPREPDDAHLRFLRWLVEHGRLEHPVAGPPPDASRRCRLDSDREAVPVRSPRSIEHPYPSLTCVPPWFGR